MPPAKKNEWTFGQIFHVVLLAAPLGAVVEHVWVRPQHQTACGQARNVASEHTPTTPRLEQERRSAGCRRYRLSLQSEPSSGAVLAAIPYLHPAIYVLTLDSIGISRVFNHLAFSFLVFHSIVQGTWLLYALWLPKLGLQKHRQNDVLGIIFLGLLILWGSRDILLFQDIHRSSSLGPYMPILGRFVDFYRDSIKYDTTSFGGGELNSRVIDIKSDILLYQYPRVLAGLPPQPKVCQPLGHLSC